MSRRFLPKLEPSLSKRKGDIFLKKKPKTSRALLISLGLGILTGAGYLAVERITEHQKEKASSFVKARGQIRGTIQFSVDRTVEEGDPDTSQKTIGL